MRKQHKTGQASNLFRITQGAIPFTIILILIEFFDELLFSIQGAALPAIRDDLTLTYAQIGLLFAIPTLVSSILEPAIMLLGDTRLRKQLVLGGGAGLLAAILLTAGSTTFPALLLAFIISYPASGAFVTLSQATLMDLHPGQEAHAMARWTLAGSLANFIGPLIMAFGFTLSLGWRWIYFALAMIALGLIGLMRFQSFPLPQRGDGQELLEQHVTASFIHSAKEALNLARSGGVLRWPLLLQLSDLMLDVFIGYVPFYLADVTGLTNTQISLTLSILMVVNLGSDAILIPLLQRFPGRKIVRYSAIATIGVYGLWLLSTLPIAQVVLLLVVRCSTVGWYQVLQGEAYAAADGRSGAVNAISTITGLLGAALAWFIGWVASQAGLSIALWLLMLGPLALAIFVPRPVED